MYDASKQMAPIGDNRTGAAAAGERARAMLEAAEEFPPTSPGDAEEIAAARVEYAGEGEVTGSVPPPLEAPAVDEATAHFIDRLGERLGFERTGVRIYQGMIAKYDAYGGFDGGPTREDLERICGEELTHFRMLGEVIEELGGDPTAVTPSANLHGVMSRGVCDVVADPRTTLVQALEALMVAERTDNDGWAMLADLAAVMGKDELARRFEAAHAVEIEHLDSVRRWISAGEGRTLPH